MGEQYCVEFECRGVPRLPLQLGKNKFFLRNLHNQRWRSVVARKLFNQLPAKPLKNPEIELTRFSKVVLEPRYLQMSFFVIMDVLVDLGVIDHEPSVPCAPIYRHVQIPYKNGKIKISIKGQCE